MGKVVHSVDAGIRPSGPGYRNIAFQEHGQCLLEFSLYACAVFLLLPSAEGSPVVGKPYGEFHGGFFEKL